MTELQRRGRRELLILLTVLGGIFLPGLVWDIGQGRHGWAPFLQAVALLAWALGVGVGVWRGDRHSRRLALGALGLLGTLLVFLGVAGGRNVFDPTALAVYERIGFHPLAALYGVGAVCLLGALALAFSAPIRAYWDRHALPQTSAQTPSAQTEGARPSAAADRGRMTT
jgi:hypothetical protein